MALDLNVKIHFYHLKEQNSLNNPIFSGVHQDISLRFYVTVCACILCILKLHVIANVVGLSQTLWLINQVTDLLVQYRNMLGLSLPRALTDQELNLCEYSFARILCNCMC